MVNKNTSIIFIKYSPNFYHKAMNAQKFFMNWERYPISSPIYKDLSLPRCYNCQGYQYKSANCFKKIVCGKCSGEHDWNICNDDNKKCVDCVFANQQYSSGYDWNYEAPGPNCPSTLTTQKFLEVESIMELANGTTTT
ncbi:unnamed protein product [Psylliodes chrysocephalus]|uniref:Uncharacterized protein n=1 Tax=Psylliodes chrysocephalus TaxID=3402493 RepID=A0A9P0G8H8_9CUCU|nr:unnamed protein product [Psylliodes chrysocephala]